jgi:hypothetical protein
LPCLCYFHVRTFAGLDLNKIIHLHLSACCLHVLHLDPEGDGSLFLQNISELLPDYMVSHPKRQHSS